MLGHAVGYEPARLSFLNAGVGCGTGFEPPLILAAQMVRRSGRPIDREPLRPPFYSQCYVTAPFALGFGLAGTFSQLQWQWAPVATVVTGAVSLGWYGTLQVAWFRRHLRESGARAFVDASIAMAECVAMLVVVTALFG